jgi:catechol 2,3-dioxygenase-like lactoylglutathione lyase family enzyme
MIKGLHHDAYRCRDSEETRGFYEDFLGLRFVSACAIDEGRGLQREPRGSRSAGRSITVSSDRFICAPPTATWSPDGRRPEAGNDPALVR